MTPVERFALAPPRPVEPVAGRARIRLQPEDFEVIEDLGFEAAGQGPHLLLRVRKRNANTGWVARELARSIGWPIGVVENLSPNRDEISIAGLQNRLGLIGMHNQADRHGGDRCFMPQPSCIWHLIAIAWSRGLGRAAGNAA